jgi:uncharacterized membrane protein YhaH (DUF805 family)
MRLISLWFGLRAPVSRQAYAASGFGLMALKYAVEAEVIRQLTGRWLSPFVYLNPLLSARAAVLDGHDWLVWALALWTLPFLWIGVSMTLRRAEDAGRSPYTRACSSTSRPRAARRSDCYHEAWCVTGCSWP